MSLAPSARPDLPQVSPQRLCGCGQPVRWSHLRYLGRGRSQAVYVCTGCGLAYRGRESDQGQGRAPAKSRRQLPNGGHPDNPVLDEEMAARLRELLTGS